MKISVKTLKGEIFQIDADPTDQVATLKQKIQAARDDLAAERQKLIHSGKVLKDEQCVGELGLAESDFIVCMVTKEVAKKPSPAPSAPAPAPVAATPAPAPVAAAAAAAPATPAAAAAAVPAPVPAAPARTPQVSAEAVAALVGMGFPEPEVRAALGAAMGNADLAYEFLLTGIPEGLPSSPLAAPSSSPSTGTGTGTGAVSIETLRSHPQFNNLKQLVQTNPAALSQVLDVIGQQSPELLAAIHANNEAFLSMMNEPITDTPAVPAAAAAAEQGPDPVQLIQALAQMPPAQRAQVAPSLGMSAEQLEGFLGMMAQMPQDQLRQVLGSMGMAGGAAGGAGAGAAGHGGGGGGGHVIHLTAEEMASVERLQALGFSQQQAAQAFIACDKNEALAANLLLEGGWMDDDAGDYGGDDAYN